ncbi:2-hydroxychromene-2-carboxylate isomerase [Hoeflea sp.]|uniref:2-hydroxychromene-2-carboxylate isomerase n=1 Tax=Hoeflea sp. TaxID=1940281 RepID=UPI003B0131F3
MKIEIWFEFASTYSYLSVSRAEDLLRDAKVDYEWKPFLLGPIFRSKGMETSPFVLDATKGAYMWRDLERRAMHYGLPFVRPPVFPANSLHAARIMTAALGQPWAGLFARAVFSAQFAHGREISDTQVLATALRDCGADPDHWLTLASSDAIKAELRERTQTAHTSGIFGAPSFRVGQELFWGDDRFEDAIAWALADSRG